MRAIERQTMTQTELFAGLTRQIAEDAIQAGWIKPCCTKVPERGRTKKIYSVRDFRQVEQRILNGEYPQTK